ncbi:MAG: hypothetical protein KKE73_04350 [Proteobacteria bacterium]|nr:hypothetical protein [Pseudomonadota bacterium]
MDSIATISTSEGPTSILIEGLEQEAGPGAGIPTGASLCTSAGAHAEAVFTDGTVISLGELSSLVVLNFSFNPDQPDHWTLNLHLNQGTLRITSGSIASNHEGGIHISSDMAGIRMDEHGGDILVRDGLTQVGSSMTDSPQLLVTTALGTATIDSQGSILDILAGGILGIPREYSNFEWAYFKAAAPLLADTTDEATRAEQTPSQEEDDTNEDVGREAHHSSFGDADIHYEDYGDGHNLLTLFETYFGDHGTAPGHALSWLQTPGELVPTTSLDAELGTTAEPTLAMTAPHESPFEAHGEHAQTLFGYVRELLENQHDELSSLFNRWLGGNGQEQTEVAEDAPHENGTEELSGTTAAMQSSPDFIDQNNAQSSPRNDSYDTADSYLSPGAEAMDSSSSMESANNIFQNSCPQNSAPVFRFSPDSEALFGGSESDDLTQAEDTPDYDAWNASALSSETTTSDTTISVPQYSLGFEFIRIHVGWFYISIPIPVIKTEWTQEIISSETTTTTLYDDGATETQTMFDSDADGNWDQSTSNLLYDDGTQRIVSLYDADDDGNWDSYETSLIYSDGTTAASDSGDYAQACDEVLAQLALAADEPGVS